MSGDLDRDEGPPTLAERRRRRRFDGGLERDYDLALARIIHGKPVRGGYLAALSIVSGLEAEAIKKRVNRLLDREPDALETEEPGMDGRDGEYLQKRYGQSKDPAIRDFLASLRRREG
jgi:hypothetical protein